VQQSLEQTLGEQKTAEVRASYDALADQYVRHIFDELQHKPLDRELLDRFAARVRGRGLVCDLGCGPGHVAGYLRARGVEVCGVDLSAQMVEHATRLNPGIGFMQGNMLSLDQADGAWAGIAAFYAIVNLPRNDVVHAFREMKRVLRAGGVILLGFHVGSDTLHEEELWDCKISLDFYLFQPQEVEGHLRRAGFEIEEITEREPYPEVEYPSRRAYILARKPGERKK